jgi:predicted SnoaL-like aldol condensation-catalyzing enzyme
MNYDTIHKVLGEGDFVLTASEGQFDGKHVSFYDLFRVANGRIAEHWDTIEEIPPEAEWRNGNGKF